MKKRICFIEIIFSILCLFSFITNTKALEKLANVTNIVMDESTGIWTWDAVENAEEYTMILYSGEDYVPNANYNTDTNSTGFNTQQYLSKNSKYKLKIYASADDYEDSDEVFSSEFTYSGNTLATPTGLVWSGTTTTNWNKVDPNCEKIYITLYHVTKTNTEGLATHVYSDNNETSFDFSENMQDGNVYKFGVQCVNDSIPGSIVVSSEAMSSNLKYNLPKVDAPTNVRWIDGFGLAFDYVSGNNGFAYSLYDASDDSSTSGGVYGKGNFIPEEALTSNLVDGNSYYIKVYNRGDGYTTDYSEDVTSATFVYHKTTFYNDVYVGALHVSDKTANNIDGILKDIYGDKVSGTATYDKTNHILTLNNFVYNALPHRVTSSYSNLISLANDVSGNERKTTDFEINLIGNNSMTCPSGYSCVGIYDWWSKINLTGTGSLKLSNTKYGAMSGLVLDGPSLDIEYSVYGIDTGTDNAITFEYKSGDLKLKPSSSAVNYAEALNTTVKVLPSNTKTYAGSTSDMSLIANSATDKNGSDWLLTNNKYVHIYGLIDISTLSSNVVLSKNYFTYNNISQVPTITINDLVENTDFEVKYYTDSALTNEIVASDIKNAKTYYIKINGINNYKGYVTKTFTIGKATPKISKTSNLTYNGKTQYGKIKFLGVNGEILYTKSVTAKKPGKYSAYYSGNENYNSIQSYINLGVKTTKISSLKASKKAFTVKVKKQSSKYITGYQVRYSLYSNMKSSKTKTISTKYSYTSKKITKLKKKKYYYVQVRTYKKIGSKKYYSDWSSIKKVKTK